MGMPSPRALRTAATTTLLVLVAALPRPLSAQEWLNTLPQPAPVIASIQGKDELDTAARRTGAMLLLKRLLLGRAGVTYLDPARWPAPIMARWREYQAAQDAAWKQINPPIDTSCSGPFCDWRRFQRLMMTEYGVGSEFSKDLIHRYFSDQWIEEYATYDRSIGIILAAEPPPQTLANNPRARGVGTALAITAPGVLLLMLGIRKGRELERYEFENMTDGGVVEFEGYDKMRKHKGSAALVKLLYTVGIPWTGIGIIFLLISIYGPT